MIDESVKAEKVPEIPLKIDLLRKMIEGTAELIDQLEAVLSKAMRGLPDNAQGSRPVVSSDTALGEKLAQCDDALHQCNDSLRSMLERLEL